MPINTINNATPANTIHFYDSKRVVEQFKQDRNKQFFEASKLINDIYNEDISSYTPSKIKEILRNDAVILYDIEAASPKDKGYGYVRSLVIGNQGKNKKNELFKGLFQYVGFEKEGDVMVIKNNCLGGKFDSERYIVKNTVSANRNNRKAIALNSYIFCGDKEFLKKVMMDFNKWMNAHIDIRSLKHF